MKTMLERLLGHLHRAVFDTTAEKVVAFTLDGPAGSKWIAKDENFDITFADGSTKHYDLNKFTMVQFAAQLAQDGMSPKNLNSETLYFSGITMLELSGEAGKDNDITLYRDILHAIFGAYSREMRQAQDMVDEGINQMFIPTANDGFLDTWGNMFGVARDGDDDDKYRKKIPLEAFRVRVNSYAIQKTVKDQTGYDITLQEPWRDIFRLDESYLSGGDKFYDGQDVGYFIVQPVSNGNVDWNAVIPIIKRNLAGGIAILKPVVQSIFYVNDPLVGNIWWQNWTQYGVFVRTDVMPRLDNGLVLSGGYEFEMNFSTTITTMWSTDNFAANQQLNGDVKEGRGRSLPFYVNWGPIDILQYHTGTYQGAFLQMYPTDPRTWMIGGWDRDATWNKPYDWGVYFKRTDLQDKFSVDATGIIPSSTVTSQATVGITWDDPQAWVDDMDWGTGTAPFFGAWFDSSNTVTVTETAANEWEMTMSRAVKTLFNVRVQTQADREHTTALQGYTWALSGAATGPAVVAAVNDHTWSVHTTGTGDVVINVIGTQTSTGATVTSKLTIHLIP